MKIKKDCKIELAASKDQTRYTITEPYLDMTQETPVMVATNGFIIAVVPVETNEHDKSGFVTADSLKAMRKVKLCAEMTCNCQLSVFTGPTFTRPELGNYPNWRQVIPAKDRESTFKVGLNIKLLWELCQAIGCETARLEFKDNMDAVMVYPTTIGSSFHSTKPAANMDAYGAIMPTRLA